jgi:hypothetical protein
MANPYTSETNYVPPPSTQPQPKPYSETNYVSPPSTQKKSSSGMEYTLEKNYVPDPTKKRLWEPLVKP